MRKAMIWVCLFQLILAGATWSQATTGSIVGRVTDQSEAPVSGAKVTAVNEQTGVKYPGKTDTDGNYAVYGLPPGTYTIAAERDGFQSSAISGVLLVIDQKQLLNFGLKVGAVTETVMVTAAPTMLQTQSVETGEVIQSHEILDLPLLGRNFYDLTILTAGVVQVGGSINALSFAVNGQREYANSIQIDGIESTTNRTQDITATPSVDSIEEFKVSTSAYSAQFGKAAGADIAIQTKAGGKSYHGTAYEFFRPNFLAAKSFAFQGAKNPPPVLKRHNYGGTLGGPVIRKKTFFFASYEGTHETNAYDYVFFTPPLNQIKVLPDGSVDLSGLVDPSSGKQIPVYDPAVSVNCYGGCYKQFAGNSIPANRVSTAGLNTLMKFFPQPNLPGTSHGWFDNFQVHSPVTFHQKLADARLDHNFSDNDRLSFVYHYNNSDQLVTDPYTGHNVVGGGGDQSNYQTSGAQQYVLTETHLFSTRFLNEARVGYVYYNLEQYSPINGQDLSSKYGVGNIFVPGYPATAAYPWIFMGLGEQIGGSTYKPFLIEDNNFQLSDNVILSQLGKHELRFGGGFRRLNSHPNFSFFPTGFFYFGGPYAAMTSDWSYTSPLNDFSGATLYGNGGSDIADLILGLPLDVQRGLQLTKPYTRSWEMDYYAEDTFKVNRRLTLVLGMRYEFQAPYTEAGNNASNYDPKTDSLLLAGRGANSAGLMNTRWNDFAPRVGVVFQWDPKTVVRAGYGMYYSPENDGREDILTKNYPFATQQVFTDNPYNGPASPTQPFTYIMDIGVPRSTAIPI